MTGGSHAGTPDHPDVRSELKGGHAHASTHAKADAVPVPGALSQSGAEGGAQGAGGGSLDKLGSKSANAKIGNYFSDLVSAAKAEDHWDSKKAAVVTTQVASHALSLLIDTIPAAFYSTQPRRFGCGPQIHFGK